MSASDEGYKIALEEMKASSAVGGIPVGSSIVSKDGKVLGRGRNMLYQNGSPILHGETAAFDNARDHKKEFEGATIYTTLSPCPMCAGAMIWFKVARCVIGDNKNMNGREELLRSHGIEVILLDDKEAMDELERYQAETPEKWSGV